MTNKEPVQSLIIKKQNTQRWFKFLIRAIPESNIHFKAIMMESDNQQNKAKQPLNHNQHKPTKPEQINQIQQMKASKVLDIEDSANPIIKKNQYKPDHFNTFNGAGESEKIINILLRYLRGEACNFDSVPTSTHIQNFSLT